MISLAYFSSAVSPMSSHELSALLAQAHANNTRLGVTGLLCHHDGSFLQFLEGEAGAVDGLFARIEADPRHHAVLQVHRADIGARAFGDWAMAIVQPAGVSAAERAFTRELRAIAIASEAAHTPALEGLLSVFRAWLR